MAVTLIRDADQLTADLIVELQLQDVARYSDTSKGKSRDPTDEELAFALQGEELKHVDSFFKDRRMALSFAAAVEADGAIVAKNQAEEERASQDRRLARQLDSGKSTVPSANIKSKTVDLDDETLAKLQMMYASRSKDYNDGIEVEQAESSAWASGRSHQLGTKARQCVACREEVRFIDVARVPCQHEYCRPCLQELYKASITDESLFPPRCCRKPINMSVARIFLNSELVREYEKKKIEFETPNRTYCYNTQCSAFIEPSHIDGEKATCPNCNYMTCTNCKKRVHTGDCPDDTALQQLLATAKANGWQRCYSCRRLVELDHGCNHMTCRCGAQFCYNCGIAWKKCACEQWNERRLLARANQIIRRDAPANQGIPDTRNTHDTGRGSQETGVGEGNATSHLNSQARAQNNRDALVARTVQELRENHECEHDGWRWIPGHHQCEECYHYLPEYIFECRTCRLRACNRCRRNRL